MYSSNRSLPVSTCSGRFKLPRLGLPLLGALLKREFGIEVKVYFQEISLTGAR